MQHDNREMRWLRKELSKVRDHRDALRHHVNDLNGRMSRFITKESDAIEELVEQIRLDDAKS